MSYKPHQSDPAPTLAEAEALEAQRQANRIRTANVVAGAMALSAVFIFVLGIWMFFDGSTPSGLVMCVFSILVVPFLFWLRRRLISSPGAARGTSESSQQ